MALNQAYENESGESQAMNHAIVFTSASASDFHLKSSGHPVCQKLLLREWHANSSAAPQAMEPTVSIAIHHLGSPAWESIQRNSGLQIR